jgi:hypothetical protein
LNELTTCARAYGGDHEWQVVARKVSLHAIGAGSQEGFVDYYDRGIFFYFVLDYSHGRKINPLLQSIIFSVT